MLAVLLFTFLLSNTFALHFENNECVVSGYGDSSSTCYLDTDESTVIHHATEKHGYDIETYSVTTPDGYILKIFHIFKPNKARGPVILTHGLASNSVPWTHFGKKSLAFVLVDHGYDVWLGNTRGTTYANKHVKLTVDDSKYWNFNLDTIAAIDIPEQLKFVYNKTGKKSLYIGHSMGTTVAFMYSSASSEEAKKLLRGIVALAPAVYLNGTFLDEFKPILLKLIHALDLFRIRTFFNREKSLRSFLTNLCKDDHKFCLEMMFATTGKSKLLKKEELLSFLKILPSLFSVDQAHQYLQFVQNKQFRKFDYGRQKNLKIYGTEKPPAYNLSSVDLPVCLLYGESDPLHKKQNLGRLYNELGTKRKSKHPVPSESSSDKYSHIDFLIPSEKYPYTDWLFSYCLESTDF